MVKLVSPDWIGVGFRSLMFMTFLVGCGQKLCGSDGIASNGEAVVATIFDLYDQQSSYSYNPQRAYGYGGADPCSINDGLAAGASLEFRTAGTSQKGTMTCAVITADLLSAPSEITLEGVSQDELAGAQVARSDSLLYATESVSVAGCSGIYAFAVIDGGAPGGAFSAPVAGMPPPAVVYRLFMPSSSSCSSCDDNFVAQLSKPTM